MNLSLDLVHSLRLMRKNCGFIGLCVLVVGLGLGLSVTMYSIISASVYRTLPYPDGDKFVAIQHYSETDNQLPNDFFDAHTFQQFKARANSYRVLGAWHDALTTLSDGEIASQFYGAKLSPELLQATSIQPLLGRSLVPGDAQPGAEPVVLLSFDVWQNYYAGAPDIVGQTSRVNSTSHTIIGVMPEQFRFPLAGELWLPLILPANPSPGGESSYRIMGVLADQVDLPSATLEVEGISQALQEEWPEHYSQQSALVDAFTRSIAPPMALYHVLTAFTICIVLLACLNVANLLVVRANERGAEYAIRKALGASTRRLIQVVLLDSAVVCIGGLLLGVGVAYLGMSTYQRVVEELWYGFTATELGQNYIWAPGSFWVATLTIVLIWLASSSLAIWKVRRTDISKQLSSGASGSVDSASSVTTGALVGFELVVSCFLLIVSGVLLGGASHLTNLDEGVASENRLTGRINLPSANYQNVEAIENYRTQLSQALLEQPGIEAVTFTSALPSQSGAQIPFSLEDRDLSINDRYPTMGVVRIADNYFSTMGSRLLEGRDFDGTDTADSQPVVIVGENFAQNMWPDDSALGKRIQLRLESGQTEWLTIVGVAQHILQDMPFMGASTPSFYRPFSQSAAIPNPLVNAAAQSAGEQFSLVVEVNGNPNDFQHILQSTAKTVDRDIPLTFVMSLDKLLENSHAVETFINLVSSPFALFTLILAITGIYAIVSRSVMQRRQEIGVRRALGSNNAKVLWVFVRQGLIYLFVGLIIGGGLAVFASIALSNFLTNVIAWVPWVTLGVGLGLAFLVVFSAYNPARGLVALEPGDALKYD